MILDARSVPHGTAVDTEVCIVGAGPAGIALAREFIAAAFRVVLLESGGMDFDLDTQELYKGQSTGRPFPPMTASRLRYFGGTTNHWGGWCVPYDDIDFEPRDDLPYHGWPFPKSHLDPWYRRAQEVCQLGPYDYRPASWGISPDKVPPPFDGPDFECKLLQISHVHFGPTYAEELRHAPRVTVYLHANAFNLDATETDGEIQALSVKTLSGNSFSVRARIYIVATGGIENARLLLASGKEGGNGLGNARDLVGRFFMMHLVYSAGTLVPLHPRMTFDFRREDTYPGFGGAHPFYSFIGLSGESMRRRHLPNIQLSWSYKFSPVVDAVKALDRVVHGERAGGSWLSDLSEVARNLGGVSNFALHKALFGEGVPIEAMPAHATSEQQPNPNSRITLGSQRDRLGMREVVVDWQLTPEDKTGTVATLRLLAAEVGRTGFARFRPQVTDDSPWPSDFFGNEHHMGTTRMHRDPTHGVVDENCRVHSVANLYVAGSSVFPCGGAYNPTLTIVALALRLADHIKAQLA